MTNKTIFIDFFGNSPKIKIMNFFIENHRTGWNLMEICRNTHVGYSTLKIMLPKLLKQGILIIENQYGKIKIYKLNMNNPKVKLLFKFDWELTKLQ